MNPSLAALKLVLDGLGIPSDISTMRRRKAIQKAVYLGQLAGVDLGYRFGWYIKGPYSPPLATAYYELAEALESGEPVGHELRTDLRARLEGMRPIMNPPPGVALSQEDWLELVASLHYLMRIRHEALPIARQTLQRAKPALAPHVDAAHQELSTHALI